MGLGGWCHPHYPLMLWDQKQNTSVLQDVGPSGRQGFLRGAGWRWAVGLSQEGWSRVL